jgi:zinc D-Ala-D-Ala carboxypeptidase
MNLLAKKIFGCEKKLVKTMPDYQWFDINDFACKETGENEISEEFVACLDALRTVCGFPFIITSGYRSPEHSAERDKPSGGGTHTQGIAADIKVSGGAQRYLIQKHAYKMGFTGIGVAKTFIHLDMRETEAMSWSY